ncbi:MAG TPA: hypothetical protein VMT70_12310 [Vicinamibacteria bacterium]|nr:hypothetical protein [Vicinamibacteria bacterium]
MSRGDVAEWARTHEASFEVAPLVEMVKGRQVQVGFTLGLYARLPLGSGPGPERRAAAAEIWDELRAIAQSLAPPEEGRARVEVESPRTAAFFQPEGQMRPEVAFSARVFRGDDYFTEVTADEEKKVHGVVQRLTDLGLKERPRRTPS